MILEGDCRAMLATLPAGSVQTCVTSPPYFGLRDYGTGEWDGGDAACDHRGAPQQSTSSTLAGNGHGPDRLSPALQAQTVPVRECPCGARRVDRQIGLEPTPDEFVAALVAVFREVRRVLRDDGTVWLNLGDSYNAYNGNRAPAAGLNAAADGQRNTPGRGLTFDGCKPKDLIGIPWMVAFALRADGWYLRSDIIWNKPNPMPESVTDRPTKSHEYLFLLSKGPRYFWDADAVREGWADERNGDSGAVLDVGDASVLRSDGGRTRPPQVAGRNKRSVWTVATAPFSGWTETVRRVRVAADDAGDDTTRIASPDCPVHGSPGQPGPTGGRDGHAVDDPTRSHGNDADPARAQQPGSAPTDPPREPWTQDGSSHSTGQPCAPAATPHSNESRRTDPAPATRHACTPSAGTSPRTGDTSGLPVSAAPHGSTPASSSATGESGARPSAGTPDHKSHSGSCTCEYYRETTEKTSHFATFPPKLIEPCILAGSPPGGTVLDPFAGAGTVGVVCGWHGREHVGIELNPEYAAMARERIALEGRPGGRPAHHEPVAVIAGQLGLL